MSVCQKRFERDQKIKGGRERDGQTAIQAENQRHRQIAGRVQERERVQERKRRQRDREKKRKKVRQRKK